MLEGWLMTSAPSAACQLPSAAGDTVLAAGTTQIDINSVAYSEQSASTLGPGSQVCVELDRAQYDTPLITEHTAWSRRYWASSCLIEPRMIPRTIC